MLENLFLRILILLLMFFVSCTSFSEEDNRDSLKNITQKKVFKISAESIVSLEVYLSKEKFDLLKTQIIDKEFAQQTLNLVDELSQNDFTDEEIEYTQQSIQFYFEILEKINVVAPLVYSLNEIKQKIDKIEDALDSLMDDEKVVASEKIKQLESQLESYRNGFKMTVQESGLSNINFNKLPGMLLDLGYDESFYQVIYVEFSSYLSVAKKLDAAASILKSMEKISNEIDMLELKLKKAETREQKAIITTNIQKLVKRKKLLEQDFTLNVTGIDVANLEKKEDDKINWENELKKIFSPIIINLKNFTEPARKIELLNTNIAIYEQQLPKMEKAVEQINILLLESQNSKVKKRILLEKDFWVQQEKELNTKLEVAKQQLLELESHKITTSEAFDGLAETVSSEQGRNILLAILAFFLMFIALHILRRFILLINPLNYIPRFKSVANIIDVILKVLIFIISILTLMVALYMVGAMMTLAIVAFILLGMIWALRNTLPLFVEQIKLLLGYGPVRRGEKVIYNGIQWLVESIGGYSYFSNPLLTGNTVRLPIKDLIAMRSRPYDEKEPWFPTRENDWIILSDGYYGKVVIQTPDIIQVDTLRGSFKSYTPSDFLEKNPQNLSINIFSVNNILNLDFRHSDIVIKEVSEKVTAMLKEKIEQEFYGKYLKRIIVQLKNFDNSSLNVVTIAMFSGEAASEYIEIGWLLQQVALEACNKYGWKISYNQVALHQVNPITLTSENQFSGELST